MIEEPSKPVKEPKATVRVLAALTSRGAAVYLPQRRLRKERA
jgi:hypothetical protein